MHKCRTYGSRARHRLTRFEMALTECATQPDKCFLGKIQAFVLPMKDAPMPLKSAPTEREFHKGTFVDFFLRNPVSENADTKAKFHQFLGRLHAANLDYGVQDHILFA